MSTNLRNQSAETLVNICGDANKNDRILIVCEDLTKDIAELISKKAKEISNSVEVINIKPFSIHGEEPPALASERMLESTLIFGLTKMSMAHSAARAKANANGAKYLSLPDFSWDVMESPALSADFRSITKTAERLASVLTSAKAATLTSALGTNLTFNLSGRKANSAPGWCYAPGTIASPPDAEVNIPPVEDDTSGIVVVDGSIPCREIGLLKSPITLHVKNGKVFKIEGPNSEKLNQLFEKVGDERSRVVAELGIGLNPMAELCGRMLEDEGALGCIHLGIGSNITLGGKNVVPFHLDHILRSPSLSLDGQLLVENGNIRP